MRGFTGICNTRHFVYMLALFAGVILLPACGGHRLQSDVFHYNEITGIASLDPAFAKNNSVIWATSQLYNTLIETDAQLQIQPSLAYRWEVDSGGKCYRFYLRPDVRFHDDPVFPNGEGRNVCASDVVFTWSRLIDPATASPGAWVLNDRVALDRPFRALNDSVVELHLRQPFAPLLSLLSMNYCAIVAPEAVKQYGASFRTHPVGTGPFRLKRWVEGQALVLERNPYYFERDTFGHALPYLSGVSVSFYDSKITEFLEFQQGRLDFVNDIESSFKDELLTPDGTLQASWKDRLQLYKHPYLNTEYLGILMDSSQAQVRQSPLSNRLIRLAMNYSIDRLKLMRYQRNSIGAAAVHGFIPNGMPGYSEDTVHRVAGYPYDPARASRLLAEAGYPGGKGLTTIKLTTIPVYADIAQWLVAAWRAAGIPVRVDVVPKSTLLTETANGSSLFFRGSWIADYPDAENYLSVFYSKHPAPPNYTRFTDAAFDQMYEDLLAVTSDSLRRTKIFAMEERLINQAPFIPLWYDEVVHLVQPTVQGWQPNALNRLDLRRVKKRPPAK